ncbi:PEP-CTERM sorting domain-containing protein [Sedimenticola sp.]|uniref:PEP-CTERM sorting domain-containing protein n=1 Tax=Sedimenticola sp. TaxID=1940285 RepID=UPI003D14966E
MEFKLLYKSSEIVCHHNDNVGTDTESTTNENGLIMRRMTSSVIMIALFVISAQIQATPLTITQTVAFTHTDPDDEVACTNEVGTLGGRNSCSTSKDFYSRFRFNTFDPNLGTLTKASLITRWDLQGSFILRPEDSIFSVGTDGSYSVLLNTYFDPVGNNNNNLFGLQIFAFPDEADRITPHGVGFSQQKVNNAYVDPVIQAWQVNGNTRYDYEGDILDNFLGIGTDINRPLIGLFDYQLRAGLEGDGLDCQTLNACGATNRISGIFNSFSRLIYEYEPLTVPGPTVDVPEPGTLVLLSLGLLGISRTRRKPKSVT